MRTIKTLEGADMVAWFDLDAERAKAAATEYGGTVFDSAEKLLSEGGVDCVYICTPPFAHGDLEMAAIAAKKPIFLEKPIGVDMKVVRSIEKAVNDAGLITSVGYHFRYFAATAKAEAALAGKTITTVMGFWMGGFPGVYWWRRMDMSGGQMCEQTTHIVDMARLFAGEVKAVCAAYALLCLKDVEDITVPDTGTMTLFFENGAVGTISNCCHLPMGGRVGIDVIACDTMASMDGNHLVLRTAEGVEDVSLDNNPTAVEDAAFIKAVGTGDASGIRSPYSDAARSLAVSIAANVSAEQHSIIQVSDVG
jgi:predicted dehydrogenase